MMQDDEDAKPLALSSAAVSFSHVTHEYTPGNPVLRDVTFNVPGGSTTALVRCGTCALFTSLSNRCSLGMLETCVHPAAVRARGMVSCVRKSVPCCNAPALTRAASVARSAQLAAASLRC